MACFFVNARVGLAKAVLAVECAGTLIGLEDFKAPRILAPEKRASKPHSLFERMDKQSRYLSSQHRDEALYLAILDDRCLYFG